jgi:hypothetical protein
MPTGQNVRDRSTSNPAAAADSATMDPNAQLDSLMPVMAAIDTDRRQSERHSFPAVQRVQPCGRNGMPLDGDFQLVRCHDLSTSGISFYWPTAPNFDHVIVALASPNGTTRVLAHVAFQGRQPGDHGEYLIGCRFLRRLPH